MPKKRRFTLGPGTAAENLLKLPSHREMKRQLSSQGQVGIGLSCFPALVGACKFMEKKTAFVAAASSVLNAHNIDVKNSKDRDRLVKRIFKAMELPGSPCANHHATLAALCCLTSDETKEESVSALYAFMDKDGEHGLSKDELRPWTEPMFRMLDPQKEKMTPRELDAHCDQLMSEMNNDDDINISREEFGAWFDKALTRGVMGSEAAAAVGGAGGEEGGATPQTDDGGLGSQTVVRKQRRQTDGELRRNTAVQKQRRSTDVGQSAAGKHGGRTFDRGDFQLIREEKEVSAAAASLPTRVFIHNARRLRSSDGNGTSDPFVRVSWRANAKSKWVDSKKKTKVIHKSLDPDWKSEQLDFIIDQVSAIVCVCV